MLQKNKPWLFVLFFIVCTSLLFPLPIYLVKPGEAHLVYEVVKPRTYTNSNQNGQWLFLTVKLTQINAISYMKSLLDRDARVIPKSSLTQDGDLQSYLHEQQIVMKNAQMDALRCAETLAENQFRTEATERFEFIPSEVGGPSAGVMMCLGFLDLMMPEDLSLGKRVAGTGTILSDDGIGDVGGVDLKIQVAEMAEADLFLYPTNPRNDEIIEQYQKQNSSSNLRFCPIKKMSDALNCLKNKS